VQPLADVQQSSIPAISISFLETGAVIMPVPWGAPAQNHSGLSPCMEWCGAHQSCCPGSFSAQGQWRACPSDGGDAQLNVTVVVPNGYKCLEPGVLASPCLLLHRHDLQDLTLEVNNPMKKSIISDSLMGREKR
jgi:hypothetical protein